MRKANKLIYLGFMIVILGVFMYSCTQEDTISKDINEKVKEDVTLKTENRAADDNPILVLSDDDILNIAEGHNAYLATLFENFDYSAPDLEQELLDQALANPLYDSDATQITEIFNEASTYKENLLFEVLNDPIAESYIGAAKNIVKSATSISSINAEIDNLVNEANNNADLVQKDAVQLYCEVLKKSVFFWFAPDMGGSGVGDEILKTWEDEDETSNRPPGWFIGAADAVGGTLGAIGGGLLGAIAGGSLASAGAGLMGWG